MEEEAINMAKEGKKVATTAAALREVNDLAVQFSIAISLKRIADMMEAK